MADWTMTPEEMEVAAATHAGALRLGGYMVVFIGFAYVGFVLAGVLGLGFSIGWVLYRLEYPELIIIVVPSVLYLFVSVARACWYVFPAREGVRLTRDEAPALFSTIDDLSAQFNATLHRVFINREFRCLGKKYAALRDTRLATQ